MSDSSVTDHFNLCTYDDSIDFKSSMGNGGGS